MCRTYGVRYNIRRRNNRNQSKQIALKYANAEKQLALSDSNFYNQPKEVQQQAIISTIKKEGAKNMSLTQFKETYGGSNPSVNPNIAPIIRQEMDDDAAQVWDQARKEQLASIQPRTVLDDVITGLKIGTANVIGGTADLGAATLPGKQETPKSIVTGKQIGRASCRERVSSPV